MMDHVGGGWSDGGGVEQRGVIVPLVATLTTVLLLVVRVLVYHAVRCFFLPVSGPPRLPRTGAPVLVSYQEPSQDDQGLLRAVVQVLIDVVIQPTCLIISATMLILSPSLLQAGFTKWSSSMDIAMSVTLGGFVSQGVICIFKLPRFKPCFTRGSTVIMFHYLFASCLYGYLLHTRTAAILGIVGIMSQVPLLLVRLQKLLFSDVCPKARIVNLVASLLLILILSLATSWTLFGLAVKHQLPSVNGMVAGYVVWIAVTYFTCVYLHTVVDIIKQLCINSCGQSETLPLLATCAVTPKTSKPPPEGSTTKIILIS